jgi:DNA-directed RNA polymerase subunit RPC12/RpoP
MKKFTMRDEEFICENCNKKVEKLNYTARDHCPYCLYSKHVDIMPGDRKNSCQGLLKPIAIEKFKDTYKIVYKCSKCNQIHKNIVASDDDMDLIIELTKETPKY